jgi:hypothetical protein
MDIKTEGLLNTVICAFEADSYSDSIIIVYKDNFQVIGPWFDEASAIDAVIYANNTGREFVVQTWNHKG